MNPSPRFAAGRHYHASPVIALVAAVLTLSACGTDGGESGGTAPGSASFPMSGDTGDTGGSGSSASNGASAADAREDEAVRTVYRGVLGNLRVADFAGDGVGADRLSGDFGYTTADVNADGTPELLVRASGTEFSSIRVFGVDSGRTAPVSPSQLFHEGASSAGGARASLEATADSAGLLQSDWMGGTGASQTTLWVFDGSEMKDSGQTWNYQLNQEPPELESRRVGLSWTPVSDLSVLDALTTGGPAGGDGASTDSGPRPTPAAGAPGGTGAESAGTESSGELPGTATAPASQVGGTCGTVDGAEVTAGVSTSCGFAMNVARQAMQPGWGPGKSVDPSDPTAPTWGGSRTVTAVSPTTGQSYTLECMMNQDARGAHCEGGDGARVGLNAGRGGSLARLLTN